MKIDDKVDAVYIPDSPSRIKATDYNQIKNEIQECITLAGLTPTKDVIQLPEALKTLTQQSGAEEVAKIEAAGQEQLNSINTTGQQAVQSAQSAANTATSKAAEAADSAAAANSASGAATSKANAAAASAAEAETAKTDAQSAQTAAEAAKTAAQSAKTAAQAAQSQAQTAASSAAGSAASAEQNAQTCQDVAATLGNPAKSDLSNVTDIAASSAVQAALNGKAATDLSNGTKAAQMDINRIMPDAMDYVVESYSDEDGNWYRVYKSGWVEQGGLLANTSGAASATVTFLKPFLDTNYFFNYTNCWTAYVENGASIKNLTAEGLTICWYASVDPKSRWYACGQGAE